MHYVLEPPASVHPLTWILAWLFEVFCVLFFVTWILQWGFQANTHSVSSWGINCALTLVSEIFLVNSIRIFFLNVFVVELSRPMLKKLYEYLRHLKSVESQEMSLDTSIKVEQGSERLKIELYSTIEKHTTPSLIAANRTKGANFLCQTAGFQKYGAFFGRINQVPRVFDTELFEEILP